MSPSVLQFLDVAVVPSRGAAGCSCAIRARSRWPSVSASLRWSAPAVVAVLPRFTCGRSTRRRSDEGLIPAMAPDRALLSVRGVRASWLVFSGAPLSGG